MIAWHEVLEHHHQADSCIHRLPAGMKFAAALAVAMATFALRLPQSWPGFAVLAGFLAVATAAGRIPWRFLAKRLLLLEPFVMGVAAMTLARPTGWPIFVLILARSNLCLWAMVLLSATTRFSSLLKVLRYIRLPAILVAVLALMYRYLFILIDEAGRMDRARASRTFRGGRARTWKSSAAIVGQLFLRSSRRAESVYGAMCSRGWR
jgi:cobalt/nickel transport system permease protein